MKAVVAAFNQEKALIGAFSVITNLRMELFQALVKDNMIDEEKARAEAAAHETASETVTRLEAELEAVVAAMGDMMAKYRGLQVTHCHYCKESILSTLAGDCETENYRS